MGAIAIGVGGAIDGGGIGDDTIVLDALAFKTNGKVPITFVLVLIGAPVEDIDSVEDTVSHEEDEESEKLYPQLNLYPLPEDTVSHEEDEESES